MAVAVCIVSFALWKGNAWWEHVDAEFRNNRLFRPIEVPTQIRSEGGRHMLLLRANSRDSDWRDRTPLVADHGKLMHLFLIQSDDMTAFAHLHPKKVSEDEFETALPPLSSGEFSVYAEVTHQSGLARTLVSRVNVPESVGSSKTAFDIDVLPPEVPAKA